MTESKLSHTTTQESSGPSAQSFQGSGGNTSSMKGASNPAVGGDQTREDGPAQEIAGTLPADFSLKGMKAEYKGEDKTVPNPMGDKANDGEPLQTAGAGGDSNHRGAQSHDFDIPATEDASRPREATGDNAKY